MASKKGRSRASSTIFHPSPWAKCDFWTNLLTQATYGAFYEHLHVERVRQLRHQLDFHFTPKHGSWLNMAEIEFSALSRQCLDRRLGRAQQLEEEALIWQAHRNAAAIKVNWSFPTEKARDTLKSRYAEIS